MKERLTKKENVLIATMLFGLFFGAGNLIFPAYMGQLAGKNMWQAIVGFVITGVGLPLLGIVPEDPNVMLSANRGEPLILVSNRGAAIAYLNIAKRILGQRAPLMRIR